MNKTILAIRSNVLKIRYRIYIVNIKSSELFLNYIIVAKKKYLSTETV